MIGEWRRQGRITTLLLVVGSVILPLFLSMDVDSLFHQSLSYKVLSSSSHHRGLFLEIPPEFLLGFLPQFSPPDVEVPFQSLHQAIPSR